MKLQIVAFSLFTSGLAFAGEVQLKEESYAFKLKADVQAVPQTFHSLSLVTQKWKDLPIVELVKQGSAVKQGESLLQFNTEALEKEIAKQMKQNISRKLNFDKIEQEYTELQVNTKRAVTKAELTYKRKKEDFDYAVKVTIPEGIKSAKQSVKNATFGLEYSTEEFEQLKKMYAADDLTEETEEIILTRTKRDVERAVRNLTKVKRETDWLLKVKLPRDRADWDVTLSGAKLAYESEVKKLGLDLKVKKELLDVEKQTISDWVKQVKELTEDLELLAVKAPVDGVVYYGSFENGYWNFAATQKFLFKGGKIPQSSVFMTVVPEDSKLDLVGFVGAKGRSCFKPGQVGAAKISGKIEDVKFQVDKVASVASLGGKWKVTLKGDLPKGAFIQPGTATTCSVTVFESEKGIFIPLNALTVKEGKATVNVKLANGSTEKRKVVLGNVSDVKAQVRSGLEAGQVIITP